MRTFISWLIGIVVFLLIGLALARIGVSAGIPSYVNFGGTRMITHGSGRFSYDEERGGDHTTFGIATGVLSFLVALWVGRAAYFRSIGAGWSAAERDTFFAWLLGACVFTVFAGILQLAFGRFSVLLAGYVYLAIEATALFGIAWGCHQWWKNRVNRRDGK